MKIIQKKIKKSMVFGTFDLFHRGHEFYISEAKKYSESIIVVVARDSRVLSGKWFLPNDNENIRVKNIQNFLNNNFPNEKNLAILGDENDIFVPIIEHNPEILFFWYDQMVPEKILAEKFPHIVTERINSFEPEKYKSSILRKKLNKK